MLHILLLILKIIGWILLAILGIIVLLTCVVVFTPLRYELKGKCDGTLKSLDGGVTFSYFLHLISGSVWYADEQVSWKLRIAWKKLGSEEAAEEIEKAVSDEVVQATETVAEAVESVTEAVEETAENSETVDEKTTAEPEDDVGTVTENETIFPATDLSTEENEDKAERKSKASEIIHEIIQKISCKFTAICDKIKELIRKKEIVMDFLTNEIHTAAFKRVISELKRLMRKLKPKKLNGNLEFGFEDPALTGKVLAGVSMLYPYLADNVEVNPRFEEKILKGDIYIKGSVAVRPFASMGLRLLLDKNIRTTIRHAKKFKL